MARLFLDRGNRESSRFKNQWAGFVSGSGRFDPVSDMQNPSRFTMSQLFNRLKPLHFGSKTAFLLSASADAVSRNHLHDQPVERSSLCIPAIEEDSRLHKCLRINPCAWNRGKHSSIQRDEYRAVEIAACRRPAAR